MPPTTLTWTLHDIDRFDAFAHAWDSVNAAASGLPFLNSMFIGNLLRVFPERAAKIAVLGEPGLERALAILVNKRFGVWGTYQPSQLPMGAIVMDRSVNYQSLLDSLLRALPGISLLVAATQQDPLVHERPEHSRRLRTVDYIQTGWIDVQGSFDQYWDSRGKHLQQNMRTQRSKLARQGLQPTLEVVTHPQAVAEAVADYGRLEGAGWKGTAGTAIRADNDQGRFYRSVLEDFCRAGAARIYRYRFGDKVVAVDLCIESANVQVLLKTTYDESIQGLSPSSLLRQEAYRQIFDEGRIRRIEFYGRVMEWTKRWTDCRRTLYHANAYRWGVVPLAAARFAALRKALKGGDSLAAAN